MTRTIARTTIALASRADAAGSAWVHVLPAGTFQGRDGRGPYKLSDASAVINASRERAGRVKMPIDYDHAIDLAASNGSPAPAAGWIKALQSRADGIWGLVDWTPRAAEQLAQREYRYLSPVFHHASDGAVACLLRAALTNNPNLDQLTALASMETTNMDKLAELRKLLGLDDKATADDVVAKVETLTTARQAAAPDPSQYVPIGDFERVVAKVNELNQGISLQAATDHVTTQIEAGKLLPFLKEWGIALCSSNKPAFDGFVSRTKGTLQALLMSSQARVTPPGENVSTHGLDDNELAIASTVGVTPEQFSKSKQARETAAQKGTYR